MSHQIIDDLTLRNRAYQVLYALGFQPSDVGTLEGSQVSAWIEIARQVRDGEMKTPYHERIRAKCNDVMLRYIVEGRM